MKADFAVLAVFGFPDDSEDWAKGLKVVLDGAPNVTGCSGAFPAVKGFVMAVNIFLSDSLLVSSGGEVPNRAGLLL